MSTYSKGLYKLSSHEWFHVSAISKKDEMDRVPVTVFQNKKLQEFCCSLFPISAVGPQ